MTFTKKQVLGVGRPRVVRVDEFEFELSDGRVFQHPVELDPDEIPTIEEFQDYYDRWFGLLGLEHEREIINDL